MHRLEIWLCSSRSLVAATRFVLARRATPEDEYFWKVKGGARIHCRHCHADFLPVSKHVNNVWIHSFQHNHRCQLTPSITLSSATKGDDVVGASGAEVIIVDVPQLV